MADESLRIKIGADVSEFDKGVQNVNKGLSSLQKSSANAGATLTNLSRIASDAPFGFIAIQNNLDPLIQSFGSLSKQSGGTGAALKALAGSLAGPAGLAVGFSVVSALVTTAIQKYGSLTNAVVELSAAQDNASVKQRELTKAFNESLASSTGDLGKIKDYVGILNDVNASQKERLNAYNTLKKDFPSIIQNQTFENVLTAEGAKLINEKAKQTVNYILLKGKEAALIKLVEEETKKQLQAQQNAQEFIKSYNASLNLLYSLIIGGGDAAAGTLRRFRSFGEEIKNAEDNAQNFSSQLEVLRRELAKTDQGIIDPQSVIKAFRDQLKAQDKALEEGTKNAKKAKEEQLKDQIKLNKEIAKLFFQSVEEQSKAAKIELDKISKEYDDFRKQQTIDLEIDSQIGDNKLQEKINNIFKSIKKETDDFTEKIKQSVQVFNEFLNPVVDEFFTNIENGENAFKGLGDVIKKFVINAIKELVKLAAIAGFISLTSGGAISFGTAFKMASGGSNLFGGLKSVSAGGMGVNVSGQFALRGTDLVASVAASQQRINRVG